MNPTSPKTYSVIIYALTHGSLSQRKTARKLGISIGQVNKVFRWLEDNLFIERIGRKKTGGALNRGTYGLVNPTGILRAISLFRKMKENLLFELNLDLKKEKIMEYLLDRDVIFCLESALDRYDSYFRGDTICCYVNSLVEAENIRKELSSTKSGIMKIRFYSWDFNNLSITHELISTGNYTTEVQTMMDLFCDNKPHYTRELLKRKWGIEL